MSSRAAGGASAPRTSRSSTGASRRSARSKARGAWRTRLSTRTCLRAQAAGPPSSQMRARSRA
eukprot:7872642-Pyramimonas_sp.AAC.1